MREWETRTFARKPLQDAALDKLNPIRLPAERLVDGVIAAEAVRKARFFNSVEVLSPH
jgi:hypothetical protein